MSLIYEPPLQTPIKGGLFTAATVIDVKAPTRLFDGLKLHSPINCAPGFGTTELECTPQPDPKDGFRVEDDEFTPFLVWASDNCFLQDAAKVRAAARQKLAMNEQQLVEGEFATRMLTGAGVIGAPAPGEAPEFVRAVGELDAALGYKPGVIHADYHFWAWAKFYMQIDAQGKTPGGHTWAFSSGYAALGNSLIATGPTFIHRGPVNTYERVTHTENNRLVIAEREYAVSYECGITGKEVA